MDIKFSLLKVLNGREYSRRDCMYLLIGLENIPNALSPGKRVRRDMINELADELEWAKITTLF